MISKEKTNEGVLLIMLRRPEKFNSFVVEMALQMQSALDDADNDPAVRAVLITGEGRAFCAGQDLGEASDPNGPGINKIVSEHYNPIILKIRNLSKPVVAAVNGVAAGAGANIALACDIVIAAQSSSFIQAFSKIGLIPDSGGTWFLPRIIGFQKASALMFLGDKITASEAESMGMVYKVVEDNELMNEANKICNTLAAMPTKAFHLTKQALNASYTNSIADQLELEDKLQTIAGNSDDYREGVQAFLEKRVPVFSGK